LSEKQNVLDRRTFIRAVGGVCVAGGVRDVLAQSLPVGSKPLTGRLGVVVWIAESESIDEAIAGVRSLGLRTCQIGFVKLAPEVTAPVKNALARYEVEATAFSEHGPGERVFNYYEGPKTIGIVPRDTREARIRNLKLAADIATECGIPSIHTHCGFIPEDPNDPLYEESVLAMKQIASYCKERGRSFLCETGEETPITLRRMIEDVGFDNLFVNLDLANLILYGKGNPVEALEVLGKLVRGIHAKDGLLPTNTREFGKEVALGEGRVDFPVVFEQLRRLNYKGPIQIEREISGPERTKEILRSKAFLENILGKA
jgi:sugar phosphate isomerase/epimerase